MAYGACVNGRQIDASVEDRDATFATWSIARVAGLDCWYAVDLLKAEQVFAPGLLVAQEGTGIVANDRLVGIVRQCRVVVTTTGCEVVGDDADRWCTSDNGTIGHDRRAIGQRQADDPAVDRLELAVDYADA